MQVAMKKFYPIIFVLISLIVCAAPTDSGGEIPTVTMTPLMRPTEDITASPSPTPNPPRLTSMPSPLPTLLPKEKENYLLDVVKTNGNCKLPCFLGIQPGISVWEDIRKIEAPLYFRESYGPDTGDSTTLYTY